MLMCSYRVRIARAGSAIRAMRRASSAIDTAEKLAITQGLINRLINRLSIYDLIVTTRAASVVKLSAYKVRNLKKVSNSLIQYVIVFTITLI